MKEEMQPGDVFVFQGSHYAVTQLSCFGFKLRVAPVQYEGYGKVYSNTGLPVWIRKSALREAEIVDAFCTVRLTA